MSKFEEYVDKGTDVLPISKELSMIDKSDLFVSSDYNNLYPSAIAHNDSNWRKVDKAIAMNWDDSEWLCSSFNIKTWRGLKKPGFFEVK